MTAVVTSVRQRHGALGAGGRVIVGVDDSPGGLTALRWAVELARSANAPLVAVRVWALSAARLVRQAFRTAVGGIPGDVDVTIETPEGSPGPVLTRFASASGDLLVVGTTPSHGLKRAVHGSVSAYCSAHLPGQAWVIGAGPPGQNPAEPAA